MYIRKKILVLKTCGGGDDKCISSVNLFSTLYFQGNLKIMCISKTKEKDDMNLCKITDFDGIVKHFRNSV